MCGELDLCRKSVIRHTQAGFASGEHATLRNDLFQGAFADTSPAKPAPSSKFALPCTRLIPLARGKAAIFRSMSANSRRVRWLSAYGCEPSMRFLAQGCHNL